MIVKLEYIDLLYRENVEFASVAINLCAKNIVHIGLNSWGF